MCIAFPKTKEAESGNEPGWKALLLLPFRILAFAWLVLKMVGVGLQAALRSG